MNAGSQLHLTLVFVVTAAVTAVANIMKAVEAGIIKKQMKSLAFVAGVFAALCVPAADFGDAVAKRAREREGGRARVDKVVENFFRISFRNALHRTKSCRNFVA